MANTIAFITGGNRGIGFETALQLGKQGITVVLGARSESEGKEAASKLKAEGIDAHAIKFDVKNPADHGKARDFFTAQFGALDILVNNAGTHLEGEAGVEHLYAASTVPSEVLQETFAINFFGPIGLTQALLPLIRRSPAGRIVNLSSILGSVSMQADPNSPIYDMKSTAYDSSKSALNSYTTQLAHELRNESTKVNAAHPGWVQTKMGGSLAPMSIEDGAKTSVYLATLPKDGPSGGFFHLQDQLPW
jgi:NAD(P)-dependent dehydrogenase (short-subunit alcohol dehydrogenase family)